MCFGVADRDLGTGDTGADELRTLAQHANIDLRIDGRRLGADSEKEDCSKPYPTMSSHFNASFHMSKACRIETSGIICECCA